MDAKILKNFKKQKIIVLTGPTAVGKSSWSVQLAKAFNGEIVSADSMQIYKKMNIGTGKITEDQKQGIAHHLLDIIEPDQNFSVNAYVKAAEEKVFEIIGTGKIPIVVGGTGLYIIGLLQGHNFAGIAKNDKIREKYNQILIEKGSEALHEMLRSVDRESASKIMKNDNKRIIRALEIFELTGMPKSSVASKNQESPFDYLLITMNPEDRAQLYHRIDRRVEDMFRRGLIDEVRSLVKFSDCQSMQAIGYKEVLPFIAGEASLDDTVDRVKRNSRRYAKRQLTFFRGMLLQNDWIEPEHFSKAQDVVERFLA